MKALHALVPILAVTGSAFAQSTCATAVDTDPCGGTTSLNLGLPTDSPTPCGLFLTRWAKMTPALSGPLTVSNIFSGEVAVYSGSCGSLVLLDCQATSVTVNVLAGVQYYFQLGGFLGTAPVLTTSVISPNCAFQDGTTCDQSVDLDPCGDETVPFHPNTSAPAPAASCTTAADIQWYEITPNATASMTLDVIDTSGAFLPPLLTVWEGDCDNLVEIACVGTDTSPDLTLPVSAGTTYIIGVRQNLDPGGINNEGTLTIGPLPGPCGPCTDCDMDGYDAGVDCNDSDPNVNPGAQEICCNGIDDDCNGITDDAAVCLTTTSYCIAAANSVSASGAQMSASGSGDVALNCLSLSAGPIPAGEFGVFFHGAAQVQNPFGDGFQCAGGGIVRVWPPSAASGTGFVTRALDNMGPGGVDILAGISRNFQLWYRDPTGGPAGFNLSDGLEVVFY